MRIVAKGMIDSGYFGHGRMWPRHPAIELEVTPEEYARIAADQHIVSLVVPEVSAVVEPPAKYKGK